MFYLCARALHVSKFSFTIYAAYIVVVIVAVAGGHYLLWSHLAPTSMHRQILR